MIKQIILIILLSIFTTSLLAKDQDHCFNAITKHLDEAILYNKSVASRYAALSNGKSKYLSFYLISLEKMSKPLVRDLENDSLIYQENGIGLLCDELGDMKKIPAFKERLPEELRPTSFYQYDYKKFSKNLKNYMANDQFKMAYQSAIFEIKRLEQYPHQQCLTRHFLESIAQTIMLSHTHREQAKNLNLPDPIDIIKRYITIQERALFLTKYLDSLAFPLQKDGLLIYCQDIPAILPTL